MERGWRVPGTARARKVGETGRICWAKEKDRAMTGAQELFVGWLEGRTNGERGGKG